MPAEIMQAVGDLGFGNAAAAPGRQDKHIIGNPIRVALIRIDQDAGDEFIL